MASAKMVVWSVWKIEPITGGLSTQQYSLGVNRFVVGHKLKVQSDISYTTVDNMQNNITFRIGFDIHF